MPGEFKDKIVVISGASRGIGRGDRAAFAREGAQTVLASSSEKNLAAAAEGDRRRGPEAAHRRRRPAPARCLRALFKRVNERFGRCDVLVNNAGATRAGNFMELPDEAWLDGFALKFFGAVRLTRLFWPLLKASEGHVVNIIGGAARTVEPEFLIGGSVNAASANFAKGLSRLGMRNGVHVNAIHPGTTATERTEQLLEQRAAAAGQAGRGASRRRTGKERNLAAWAPRRTSRH